MQTHRTDKSLRGPACSGILTKASEAWDRHELTADSLALICHQQPTRLASPPPAEISAPAHSFTSDVHVPHLTPRPRRSSAADYASNSRSMSVFGPTGQVHIRFSFTGFASGSGCSVSSPAYYAADS